MVVPKTREEVLAKARSFKPNELKAQTDWAEVLNGFFGDYKALAIYTTEETRHMGLRIRQGVTRLGDLFKLRLNHVIK